MSSACISGASACTQGRSGIACTWARFRPSPLSLIFAALLRGNSTLSEGQHVLRLSDTADSVAGTVATFLCHGWDAGDWMLVVIKMRNWYAVERRLRRRGFPVEAALEEGRLIVLDAAMTRPAIMSGELPDRQWFFSTLGRLVARLWTTSSGRVRIYGEHAELLAEEGNFEGAYVLEQLWEEIRRRFACTVVCGYSAAHFADAANADALQKICRCHSDVRCESADILGRWLLRHDRAGVTAAS
jgi:MEDS: MEthanogen/methylotroph, DcmR Sensory domain